MDPIKTLLLTGEHNHDWCKTSPFIANLMNETGLFSVEITEQPNAVLEDAGKLSEFDLLFSDYNGARWSDAACRNFEAAVEGGKGLVIYHGASNSFTGWTAFEKMCGLHFRSGTSAHAEFTTFRVVFRDREHPITRGLRNFDQTDELYHTMKNVHSVPVHVLATAYSEPDEDAHMHGSGKDEPVAFTVSYGEGRVFHFTLGHIWPAEVYPGYTGCTHIALVGKEFRSLLLRGCEWAATGDVKRCKSET
ncbi:MAG: ThuA domain-containing protein [Planctomycetota bacterium]|jgi:type 1 glutamine amidotransferase|nr:ThuA domain-containing protein [Planctomycetota bacterium]